MGITLYSILLLALGGLVVGVFFVAWGEHQRRVDLERRVERLEASASKRLPYNVQEQVLDVAGEVNAALSKAEFLIGDLRSGLNILHRVTQTGTKGQK